MNDFNKDKDIQKWMKWLRIILNTYDKCRNILGKMIRQKNKLNESRERQKKDDMLFYNSILKDSIYFYKKSLEIRRYKFIKDISEMNQFFNKDRFPLEELYKRKRLDPREFASLYQQTPYIVGGNLIKSHWWRTYERKDVHFQT